MHNFYTSPYYRSSLIILIIFYYINNNIINNVPLNLRFKSQILERQYFPRPPLRPKTFIYVGIKKTLIYLFI